MSGAKGGPCLDWEKHPKPDKWSEVSPWILVNQEHQGCGKLGDDSENSIVLDNMPSQAWADGNKVKVEKTFGGAPPAGTPGVADFPWGRDLLRVFTND